MGAIVGLFDAFHPPLLAASDVDWIVSQLPRDAGALLVAGGDACVLLDALAERNLHVHGVASSTSMHEHCMQRLREGGRELPVFRQELDQLNVPFRYAGAVIAPPAWQTLDASRVEAAIASVQAHLIAPGVLILQAFIPEHAEHPPGAPLVEIERVKLDDGSIITRRCERHVDAQTQTVQATERYEQRKGSTVVAREDVTRRVCWRTPEEMLALVLATGFAEARIEDIASTRPGRGYAIVASLRGE